MTFKVTVPSADYRATLSQALIWDLTGAMIDRLRKTCGAQDTYAVMLSRIGRELRRDTDLATAQKLFRDFADTMDEAVKYDFPKGGA